MNSSLGLLNLPNMLTLGRVGAVPLLVVLLLFETPSASFWAAVVFALASLTDWLDGYLARKWDIVTVLGKFLDPLADKLLVMAALIMMIPMGRVPAWAVFVILAREIIITGLRSIAAADGVVIAASPLGKYKTIFQMVAIIALLLHYDTYWFFGVEWSLLQVNMHNLGIFFFVIALVLTVWSGVDYLLKFFKVIAR